MSTLKELCPEVFLPLGVIPWSPALCSCAFETTINAFYNDFFHFIELEEPRAELQKIINHSMDSEVSVGSVKVSEECAYIDLSLPLAPQTSAEGSNEDNKEEHPSSAGTDTDAAPRRVQRFTLPLSLRDAASLYNQLEPSKLGVEGSGTQLNRLLRRSHEIELSGTSLPSPLRNFDFPAARKDIITHVCPSAMGIRVEPYKMVMYAEGDFFVPHRDSINDADLIGTISIILPVEERPGGDDDDTSEHEEDLLKIFPPDQLPRRFKKDDGYHKRPPAGKAGSLVLYTGYHPSSDASYETRCTDVYREENDLTYVVDMAKIALHTCDPGDNEETAAADANGATRKGTMVVMNYGAWASDVLHQVQRVRHGYRAALTYRVYRVGYSHRFVPLTLRHSVETLANKIIPRLKNVKNPRFLDIFGMPQLMSTEEKNQDTDSASVAIPRQHVLDFQCDDLIFKEAIEEVVMCRSSNPVTNFYLGFNFRHAYPPAGLTPNALKGIDSVIYNIMSRHHRCVLFNAYDCRHTVFDTVRDMPLGAFDKYIFYTTDAPSFLKDKETHHEFTAWDQMAKRYEALTNVLWISLGYGVLVGGGESYGNWDCGTEWWYRQAHMIVTNEPSGWSRLRPYALWWTHGPEEWRVIYNEKSIMANILSYVE